jgi:hypothetical protein
VTRDDDSGAHQAEFWMTQILPQDKFHTSNL